MSTDMAYIALGSNLGDRAHELEKARLALARLPNTRVVAESSIEETAPLGDILQGPYLNQMVALETALPPRELLAALHDIERAAGRVRDVRWGPRPIDLDIVAYGCHEVHEDDLSIPHPQLPARDFWQRELRELRSGA